MITDEKMKQSYPKILKDNYHFVKEDKAGNTIVNSVIFPVVGQITLNVMSKFIMSLCDGTHSIEEIQNAILDKYSVPANVNVYDEIDMVLSRLFSIGIVGFDKENYILDRYQEKFGDYNIKCLQYNEIVPLIDQMKQKEDYCSDAYRDFNVLYSEDNLKASYSIGFESFFQIEKNGELLFEISAIPDGRISGYNIYLMHFEKDTVEEAAFVECLNFIHKIYCEVVKLPDNLFADKKVRFQYYSKMKMDKLSNFKYIGELKKEIDGQSVYLYAKDIDNQYFKEI